MRVGMNTKRTGPTLMNTDPEVSTVTPSILQDISMVTANYGNAVVFRAIVEDWFNFLGGRPGEVVVVDGGSNGDMQSVYWQMYQEGLIDKLQLIRPDHEDNSRARCFVQEHTVGAIASKPYLLWFKTDTLPFRRGHDSWLAEAMGYLERPEVFCISGSVNYDCRLHDAHDGWFHSQRFTENFSFMKRQRYIDAFEEFAGTYVSSGFRGENPAATTGQDRYLVEVAMQAYMERHRMYSLMRIEDDTWTVFHTNARDEHLARVRHKYLAREDVTRHMNAAGFSVQYPRGVFYGMPQPPRLTRARIAIGASRVGPLWRAIKRALVGDRE